MTENVHASLEFLEEHRSEMVTRRRQARGTTICTGCGGHIHEGEPVMAIGKTISTALESFARSGTEIRLRLSFQKFALMCLECGDRWEVGPGPAECDRGEHHEA